MSLILCIETGTDVCSIALARDGTLLALRESSGERDHARLVGTYTDEILKAEGIPVSGLDAVAVSRGPGSYTGLRIGVSFAKGLCYALGIPLIAVGSLESLARTALINSGGRLPAARTGGPVLCPMIDARRMEVYAQLFDADIKPLTEVAAVIVDGNSFSEYIFPGKEFVIFGSGAEKSREVLPAEGVKYIEVQASAAGLCFEAQRKLDSGLTEDVAYFEPFYLKDFVVTASNKKLF